jgi:hypothetical protein
MECNSRRSSDGRCSSRLSMLLLPAVYFMNKPTLGFSLSLNFFMVSTFEPISLALTGDIFVQGALCACYYCTYC